MRFDHLKSLYLSAGVFVLLLTIGFSLSERKLLWNDELYTQQTAIDAHSFADLVILQFPDGNKNPLFYIVQKSVCGIFHFHLPEAYSQQLILTRDLQSQIILRIASNIYMSASLALIFYFFTRFYSLPAAFYALGVALATPMVWFYWVEARPYSLWFLLTTVQLLLACGMFVYPKINTTGKLFWTHLLLSLTTPTSMVQIFIVTLIAAWKRKYGPKQLALVWLVPTAIAVFYYFRDAQFKIHTYMFGTNFFDVVLPERLLMAVAYVFLAVVFSRKDKASFSNRFFAFLYFLFVASAFTVLYLDLYVPIAGSQSGFFSRYLIYVVPADILMFSLASLDFRRWSRPNPWFCMNVSILLGGLVIMRGLMTYRDILALALYLHTPG